MDFDVIIPLIIVIFGTALGGLILWKIFDMVRSSIKGKKNTEITAEDFDRLARAFMQHRKEMEERMQNVETIVDGDSKDEAPPQIEEPKNRGGLSNELKQKNKV